MSGSGGAAETNTGENSIRRAADSWQEMLVEALVDEEEGDDKEIRAGYKQLEQAWLTGWWFGTCFFFMTSHIYWEEQSQLTKSYFSEG